MCHQERRCTGSQKSTGNLRFSQQWRFYIVSSGLRQHCLNKIFLIQTECCNKPTLQHTAVELMCQSESNSHSDYSHSDTMQCCTLSFKCNMQYFTNIKTETATQNCVPSLLCSQLISGILELQHTSLLKQT